MPAESTLVVAEFSVEPRMQVAFTSLNPILHLHSEFLHSELVTVQVVLAFAVLQAVPNTCLSELN